MNDFKNPYIFYLNLSDELPSFYISLSQQFEAHGFTLIPIKWDQLQTLKYASELSHLIVICPVMNLKNLTIYNQHVRKLLKYILKNETIIFLNLSSFDSINDMPIYKFYKNYFFLKAPQSMNGLVRRLTNYFYQRSTQNSLWPGGKKSRVTIQNLS